MRFWKKVLSLLLSVSAVCALAACGGKETDVDSSSQTSEEAEIRTYYGTTMEFYVSPLDPIKTDGSNFGVYGGYPRMALENMIVLLQSDAFTELLFAPQVSTEDGEGLIEEEMAAIEKMIAVYKTSVTYSYQNSKDDLDGSLVRSFIYVKIAVLKESEEDKAVAEYIRGQILDILPLYVEQNMYIPDGYNGTLCKKLTRTDEIVEFRK